MIHYFKTREEEVEYVRTHGLGVNYLSYVEETGKTSYKYREPIGLGEFIHVTGQIDTKPGQDIIGVCIIPEQMLPDGKARFVSMAAMDPNNKENGNYTEEPSMVWYLDGDNFSCDYMVKRKKVPLDNDFDGVIDGNNSWGRMSMFNSSNSNLIIANPQDLGTKYFTGTTPRIPSPYAPDGSFNPNFHYRGSEDDEWALTDYRGDLNTRDVVYSEDPGEGNCPAFYCCERFSPGYRDHEWYLPAVGELAFIPPRYEIIKNKMQEAIDAGSPGVVLSDGSYGYWCSSEYSSNDAWAVRLYNGNVNTNNKGLDKYVRAFLAVQ